MTARRHGVAVLGEPSAHVSDVGLVEVWRARCEPGATGDYVSLDPRLFIVLEPLDAEVALTGRAGEAASRGRSASFVPAGEPVRLSVQGATTIRHLDLHFDASRIGPVAGLRDVSVSVPRLMFVDERVQRMARLLEAACARAGDGPGLYGDDLVVALIAAALTGGDPGARRSLLSDRQLSLSVDFIEANCARTIRLHELAELTGLTESYFSHAFKAATGTPPHRWQRQAQVRRAKDMLSRTSVSLTEVAFASGFSDQPHLTRVFKSATGKTPAAWRAGQR
ncbi:helix-turn-helix domain-containing protein [Methylopila musalis]|uniref:Helix-turn-helix domain-containing protein n=1 Tax=Methylopila musalis TaxID=1134781 RepID=A0ABW3ZAH7_9HYPH